MAVKPIPDGYNTVTPYLMVRDAAKFIQFMSRVFGARTVEQIMRPDGRIGHTEILIGVEDVDAAFERAVQAGGIVVSRPANQFYGDRSGGVKEPSGNTIWIATHVEDVAPDELQRRAAKAMSAPGA